MNERERVLDLVKKGVLSTEEALDLLESMAVAKDEKLNQQENAKVIAEKKEPSEQTNAQHSQAEAKTAIENEAEQEELEQFLDELATKVNHVSAEIDEVNVEIKGVKEQLAQTKDLLMELNTKEELGNLSNEELDERQGIEKEIDAFKQALEKLLAEKERLEAQLSHLKKDQWAQAKEKLAAKMDLPDDWKEQASDALNQAGEKMAEASTYFGRFLKKTLRTVSDSVNENVEWKDISLRVPGVATTKFEHAYEYPETSATLIDVKVANGNVTFKSWEQPGVKVEAQIKLYGKMDALNPQTAFEDRSQIEVNDEHISFQVPNKRVRADLTFFLPKRAYDHVSLKLLNGNILVQDLEAKDIYTKSTNGDIDFVNTAATMLEIVGVNGAIDVSQGAILDSIIETVNGSVTFSTTPQTLGVSLVNGDVRLTMKENGLRRVNASSVNGSVKLAIPNDLGVEGLVKTDLGSVHSRLTEIEVIREKKEKLNQLLQFRRVSQESLAQIELSTATGSIFLKDAE
ncbi:MAG: daptomycin-sensing surface protein LiaX [Enterococcus sp.]